jgi:hypothetical protein
VTKVKSVKKFGGKGVQIGSGEKKEDGINEKTRIDVAKITK